MACHKIEQSMCHWQIMAGSGSLQACYNVVLSLKGASLLAEFAGYNSKPCALVKALLVEAQCWEVHLPKELPGMELHLGDSCAQHSFNLAPGDHSMRSVSNCDSSGVCLTSKTQPPSCNVAKECRSLFILLGRPLHFLS